MITIEYGPVYSYVRSSDPTELSKAIHELQKEFTVFMNGYFFSPKYKQGLWDGRKAFVTNSGRFLSGLLSLVVKNLRRHKHLVDLTGHPGIHPLTDTFTEIQLQEFCLRDYQAEAVNKALHYRRGIMELATNAGKTATTAGLLKLLGIPSTLFLVPRKVLLHQSAADFEKYLGVSVGKIGDSIWKPNWSGITVAMYQTLASRMSKETVKQSLKKIEVLVSDEVHFIMASDFQKVVLAVNADFRLGLSATPFRQISSERLQTVGTTGPPISKVSNLQLIEQKISVCPNVVLLTPQVPKTRVSFDQALVGATNRNKLIGQIATGLEASGRQTLVMVSTIAHANAIAAFCPTAVIAHASSGNRVEVLERLTRGDVFVCICTAIFDTGMSVDHIEGMIMASGGKSHITVLQRLGRALRVSKAKDKSLWVFDFMDLFHPHCKKHSVIRKAIYVNQKAFHMTENLLDVPGEVITAVDPTLVSSVNFSRKLEEGR